MQNEWLQPLQRSLERALQAVIEYLPNFLAALGLLLAGWFLARLFRSLTYRVVPKLYRLLPGRAFQRELKSSGMEQVLADTLSGIVYWVVFLLFFAASTEALGLPVISVLLSGLARYLPNVLAAVLIVVVGVVLANLARAAILTTSTSAGFAYGTLLAGVTRTVILLIAAIVAVDQLGVNSNALLLAIGVLIWASISGVALAFGLGAGPTVKNLLASQHLMQTYQAGQRLRIRDLEGTILEINNNGVVLDTTSGRAFIPAKEFSENPCIVLREEN